jgi:hypothetical protein
MGFDSTTARDAPARSAGSCIAWVTTPPMAVGAVDDVLRAGDRQGEAGAQEQHRVGGLVGRSALEQKDAVVSLSSKQR